MDAGGPGPLWGGSAPSAVGSELPLLRGTWRHRTCPRAGSGSGAPYGVVTDDYASPALLE